MPFNVATRVQAVTLRIIADKGYHEIEEQTGINKNTLRRIINRAIERGLDPKERPTRWKDDWFEDAPRSGRPSKKEAILSGLEQSVTLDRYAREKSCQELATDLTKAGLPCSPMTIWRTLRAAGFRKTKPTR
jgi:transposase